MIKKITKEYTELIDDLIEFRIGEWQDDKNGAIRDLLRYGFEGYINEPQEMLLKEAIKRKIYGEDVRYIIIK